DGELAGAERPWWRVGPGDGPAAAGRAGPPAPAERQPHHRRLGTARRHPRRRRGLAPAGRPPWQTWAGVAMTERRRGRYRPRLGSYSPTDAAAFFRNSEPSRM